MNWDKLEKRQAHGNIISPYIMLLEMDNPITMTLKRAIPSPIFSLLFSTRMPEVSVCFNNSVMAGDKKVNIVPAYLELPDKFNILRTQLFSDNPLQIREPSTTITLHTAKDTSIIRHVTRLDVKRFIAKEAYTLYSFLPTQVKTFMGTKFPSASFDLTDGRVNRFTALQTVKHLTRSASFTFTSFRTKFPPIVCHLTGVSKKYLTTNYALLFNLCSHRFTVSIIPQKVLEQNLASIRKISGRMIEELAK